MNSDEKILKILEDVQANIKDFQAGQKKLGAGQIILQGDVKELHGKVDNVDLKAEAIRHSRKNPRVKLWK